MKYFSRNSAAVQQSVWNRLTVNELNDALEMLEDEAADDKPEPEPESEPKPEEAENEIEPEPDQVPSVIVNVDVLRLRAGPSTNHQILARLTKNTILEVIGSENEWLKVITPDGKEGWVHGDYVMKHTGISREADDLAKKPFSADEFGLESIGLKPGMTVEEIVAKLGEPISIELEENGHMGETTSVYYEGLMLGCSSNSLWFFEITTPDIISKRGIRVGDSAESVINNYLVKNKKEFVCCGNAWNCVELYYIDIGDDTAMGGGYHRDQHTGEITSIYYWYGVPGSCAGTSVEYIIDNGVVNTIMCYAP